MYFFDTTSNKGKPIVSDNSFRRIEAVGWVMWVALAAAVTLPVSARAKKSLS
jgi:hypothetical protein